MDTFLLVLLGIFAVWLAIVAAVYALLYRRLGSRIERRWKRAAFLLGWSAFLSPGMLIGLGHGIGFAPAGLIVLAMLAVPSRWDQYAQGMGINLIVWAVTTAVFWFVGYLLRRRAGAPR